MAFYNFDRRITDPAVKPWGSSELSFWILESIPMALWLDAADSDTITLSGGTVSEWADKSGNGRHASQIGTASRPVFVSEAINSLGALLFSDDLLCTAGRVLFDPGHSIFIVLSAAPQSNNRLASQNAGSLDLGRVDLIGTSNLSPFNRMRVFFNNGANVSIYSETVAYDSTPHIAYSESTAAGRWAVRVDDGDEEGILDSQILFPLDTGFRVGGLGSTTGYFSGYICEIIVTTSPLSRKGRQGLAGYLAHKWGLEANLPSGHPYKDNAPLA